LAGWYFSANVIAGAEATRLPNDRFCCTPTPGLPLRVTSGLPECVAATAAVAQTAADLLRARVGGGLQIKGSPLGQPVKTSLRRY
jgi:hypothetical protein